INLRDSAFCYSHASLRLIRFATTLMVLIVVFQAGGGTLGAAPADEIDGGEDVIGSECDPFG
ncbi:MAG: hypothetical protein ACKO2N_01950, partial [Tabrizicola sp.]